MLSWKSSLPGAPSPVRPPSGFTVYIMYGMNRTLPARPSSLSLNFTKDSVFQLLGLTAFMRRASSSGPSMVARATSMNRRKCLRGTRACRSV